MIFSTTTTNSWVILEIPEEINYECTVQLKGEIESLTDKGERKICLNLSRANFLGTSVIGIFFFAQKHLENLSGEFCLLDPKESVNEVLETVGMTNIIKVIKDESQLQ